VLFVRRAHQAEPRWARFALPYDWGVNKAA